MSVGARDSALTLLAFDAAGGGCSAAVWHAGAVAARRGETMSRGQAERLVPMIQMVMVEAGVGYDGLDGVVVTTGPGAFTGVRIGLATARGLALARGLPILGVTSFEAILAAVPAEERAGRTLAVVIDARRADVYVQAFAADGVALGKPLALAPAGLDAALPAGGLLLAGDGVGQVEAALRDAGRDIRRSRAPACVDAGCLARLGAARGLPAHGTPPARPLYLRAPDVTLAAKEGAA